MPILGASAIDQKAAPVADFALHRNWPATKYGDAASESKAGQGDLTKNVGDVIPLNTGVATDHSSFLHSDGARHDAMTVY